MKYLVIILDKGSMLGSLSYDRQSKALRWDFEEEHQNYHDFMSKVINSIQTELGKDHSNMSNFSPKVFELLKQKLMFEYNIFLKEV